MKIIPVLNSELCVYEFDLTKHFDFDKLRHVCLQHVETFNQIQHPGHSNIKSTGFFAHSVTNQFDDLISTIESKANEVSIIMNPRHAVKTSWKILETWVLVYKKLGYVLDHSHFEFGMSSVCYISADNTSPICFHNEEIKVRTGQLLIFPGFLKHRVKPITPNLQERILFASNLYATFETRILERNAKYCKDIGTNNFFFDHLPPIDNKLIQS